MAANHEAKKQINRLIWKQRLESLRPDLSKPGSLVKLAVLGSTAVALASGAVVGINQLAKTIDWNQLDAFFGADVPPSHETSINTKSSATLAALQDLKTSTLTRTPTPTLTRTPTPTFTKTTTSTPTDTETLTPTPSRTSRPTLRPTKIVTPTLVPSSTATPGSTPWIEQGLPCDPKWSQIAGKCMVVVKPSKDLSWTPWDDTINGDIVVVSDANDYLNGVKDTEHGPWFLVP